MLAKTRLALAGHQLHTHKWQMCMGEHKTIKFNFVKYYFISHEYSKESCDFIMNVM